MRFDDVWAAVGPTEPWTTTFDPGMVEQVPAPARRWLQRSIRPGTRLAREVVLRLSGSVVQGDRRLPLIAEERLAPLQGFAWRARGRMGPITVRVFDHYLAGDGAVVVKLFGVIPMGGERGPDTVASSRGRLAGEALWVPSTLLPRPGVVWASVDEDRARVTQTIDGVDETFVVAVDGEGRMTELTMERWGDQGVDAPQRIPYGFRVLAEREFDGVTIASDLEGGWWYGTDRYDPDRASRFTVESAEFA
jgi:hypothetical protein